MSTSHFGVSAFVLIGWVFVAGITPRHAQAAQGPPEAAADSAINRTDAEAARALVVAIRSYPAPPPGPGQDVVSPSRGAGIILGTWLPSDTARPAGASAESRVPPAPGEPMVLIATAQHVLLNSSYTFVFLEGPNPRQPFRDSIQARVLPSSVVTGLDLALLAVPYGQMQDHAFEEYLDHLGDPSTLSRGIRVDPVGCPTDFGACWTVPSEPERVQFVAQEIVFDSRFVRPGSSGGALFNEQDEVVGMVRTSQPPTAEAIPIDQIVNTVEGVWAYPVRLTRPAVPRDGYPTTIGASILFPSSSDRAPSARGTFAYRVSRRTNVRGTLLRLSPSDLGGNCPADSTRNPCEAVSSAFMGGVDVGVRKNNFGASAFFEVGFAESEGRWDAGGVFVDEEYVPNWVNETVTGLAFGLGVTIDVTLLSHVILDGTVGSWTVPDPFAEVPSQEGVRADFPSLYYGVGIRFGF